jgi:hypothetical protein
MDIGKLISNGDTGFVQFRFSSLMDIGKLMTLLRFDGHEECLYN